MAKVVRREEGVLKVSPPLPPSRKILIIHFQFGPLDSVFNYKRADFLASKFWILSSLCSLLKVTGYSLLFYKFDVTDSRRR